MWYAIMFTVIFFGVYFLLLVLTGLKRAPKPGRDYDERGPYDDVGSGRCKLPSSWRK